MASTAKKKVSVAKEPAAKSAPRPAKTAPPPAERTTRRVVGGIVKSDRMQKTITVRIERLVRDTRFGKFVRRFTVCAAHDEKNEAKAGDWVEITETRPLSATKRWRLVRVVRRAAATVPAEQPAPTV